MAVPETEEAPVASIIWEAVAEMVRQCQRPVRRPVRSERGDACRRRPKPIRTVDRVSGPRGDSGQEMILAADDDVFRTKPATAQLYSINLGRCETNPAWVRHGLCASNVPSRVMCQSWSSIWFIQWTCSSLLAGGGVTMAPAGTSSRTSTLKPFVGVDRRERLTSDL